MHFRRFTVLIVLVFTVISLSLVHASSTHQRKTIDTSSPFDTALETLQKQIGYNFKTLRLLRRAMTHPSFSEENNKALGVLGADVIDTSISLRFLGKDIDMSSKELNRRKIEISKESSCAVDGTRLGLHKVVRVSPKTDSTTPAVVCGAFRAIFGAIAIDTGNSDDAGGVFSKVHGGDVGQALGRLRSHSSGPSFGFSAVLREALLR